MCILLTCNGCHPYITAGLFVRHQEYHEQHLMGNVEVGITHKGYTVYAKHESAPLTQDDGRGINAIGVSKTIEGSNL